MYDRQRLKRDKANLLEGFGNNLSYVRSQDLGGLRPCIGMVMIVRQHLGLCILVTGISAPNRLTACGSSFGPIGKYKLLKQGLMIIGPMRSNLPRRITSMVSVFLPIFDNGIGSKMDHISTDER
jgi:hypothetical protein